MTIRLMNAMQERKAALKANGKSAFTLMELLVVVLIIGVLSGIGIPVFLNQRQRAFDATVQSDLRNTVTALESAFASNLRYPATAEDIRNVGGFSPSDNVTVWVFYTRTFDNETDVVGVHGGTVGAGANGYVLVGVHHQNLDRLWILDSNGGSTPVAINTSGDVETETIDGISTSVLVGNFTRGAADPFSPEAGSVRTGE